MTSNEQFKELNRQRMKLYRDRNRKHKYTPRPKTNAGEHKQLLKVFQAVSKMDLRKEKKILANEEMKK